MLATGGFVNETNGSSPTGSHKPDITETARQQRAHKKHWNSQEKSHRQSGVSGIKREALSQLPILDRKYPPKP